MKCYQISEEYENLLNITQAIEGMKEDEDLDLIKKDLERQYEELNHNTETKIENMSKMVRNMELEASNYKEEIDRMTKKMKSINNQVDYIKNNLIKPVLEKSGKIHAGVFTVSLRKSQSVNIIDESKLDNKYKQVVTTIKISMSDIKKDLKNGDVLGAELITNQGVQIK